MNKCSNCGAPAAYWEWDNAYCLPCYREALEIEIGYARDRAAEGGPAAGTDAGYADELADELCKLPAE